MPLIVRMAFRNTLRQKRRSLLTILSLGAGYLLLNLAMSTTEGSYATVIDSFTKTQTGHVQIHAPGYLKSPSIHKKITKGKELIASLTEVEEVSAYSPRILGAGLSYHRTKATPAAILGIDPKLENATTSLERRVKKGRYLKSGLNENDRYEVMLGARLAKSLKCGLGDRLVLISQGVDGSIANDEFDVVGIVGDDQSSLRSHVFMSLTASREFFSMGDALHEVALVTEHHKDAEDLSQTLKTKLEGFKVAVAPWQVVAKEFHDAMLADKKGNQITLFIIMVMVALGVLNTILMSVMERTKEYGVLRALGTRPMMVFALVELESLILALVSIGLGFLVSLPLNYYFVYHGITLSEPFEMAGIYFDTFKGEFSLYTVLYPASVVILATALVSSYPGLRSALIRPIDALRGVQ